MKDNEKLFLIYFSVPVLIVGILFPVFLDGLRTGDFGSVKCLKEGGWMAVVYLASPYILLAGISCFKRKLRVVIPPFIGIILAQVGYHLEVASSSSTAVLGYFLAPLVQIFIIMPLGFLFGWVLNDEKGKGDVVGKV